MPVARAENENANKIRKMGKTGECGKKKKWVFY